MIPDSNDGGHCSDECKNRKIITKLLRLLKAARKEKSKLIADHGRSIRQIVHKIKEERRRTSTDHDQEIATLKQELDKSKQMNDKLVLMIQQQEQGLPSQELNNICKGMDNGKTEGVEDPFVLVQYITEIRGSPLKESDEENANIASPIDNDEVYQLKAKLIEACSQSESLKMQMALERGENRTLQEELNSYKSRCIATATLACESSIQLKQRDRRIEVLKNQIQELGYASLPKEDGTCPGEKIKLRSATKNKLLEDEGESTTAGHLFSDRELQLQGTQPDPSNQVSVAKGQVAKDLEGLSFELRGKFLIENEQVVPGLQLSPSDECTTLSETSRPSSTVNEWQDRCCFLENDLKELMNATDEIVRQKEQSHHLELKAAIAEAERISHAKLCEQKSQTHHHMKSLYQALCSECRQRIDLA